MNKYPDYVPCEFISAYHSEFLREDEKTIAQELIFNENMTAIWKPLSQRALQAGHVEWFYISLISAISSCVSGPSEWDLLTPKNKDKKAEKVSSLCKKLSNALNGTPLDKRITSYINDYGSLYSAILLNKAITDDEKEIIERNFIDDGECTRLDKNIDISYLWHAIGINGDLISEVLDRISVEAESSNFESIIKRKTDVNKVFFVRGLSSFFNKRTGMSLYNITAVISSIFLNEEITQEQVISITK